MEIGMASHHDWHPADIIAALRKKGTTLAALSRSAELSSSTLANVLSRPWPKNGLWPRRWTFILKSGPAVILIVLVRYWTEKCA
jgi:hypothetical protein